MELGPLIFYTNQSRSTEFGKPQAVVSSFLVGCLDSSHTIVLFCFYGFASIVIQRCLFLEKIKLHEFKNTVNGLKMKIRENLATRK